MNKKFMIGGCAAIAVAGNVFAAAEEDYSYFTPYASLKAGYAYLSKRNDIKYKGGFAGAVELGVSYDAWRLGLELGYKSNKIKEVGASAYGIKNLADVTPAVVAGTTAGKGFVNGYEVSVTSTTPGTNDWFFTASKISKINVLSGMLNVCYDYAMTEAWSIYAGLGLGVSKVSYTCEANKTWVDSTDHTNLAASGKLNPATITAIKNHLGQGDFVKSELSKTVFAWQLMAGFGYEFNENWKLILGYKLFNTAKVKLGDTKIKMPFNHTLEAGITYTF